MAIEITQPLKYESNKPNFERDRIDSSDTNFFSSQNPLVITTEEGNRFAKILDVGHIVWDVKTEKHYIFKKNILNGIDNYYFENISPKTVEYILNGYSENSEILTLTHSINVNTYDINQSEISQ